MINTVQVATRGSQVGGDERFYPAEAMASPWHMETVEAPLKPNQQNQRMNTPSAPSVRLWPKDGLGLSVLTVLADARPEDFRADAERPAPPTMCTAVEPAKSWKPNSASQPPPQIQ